MSAGIAPFSVSSGSHRPFLGSLQPACRARLLRAVRHSRWGKPFLIIVRDMRSAFWQAVLSGARRAAQDFGVNVIEFGTNSERDVDGQSPAPPVCPHDLIGALLGYSIVLIYAPQHTTRAYAEARALTCPLCLR
jgi:hypothetical protein